VGSIDPDGMLNGAAMKLRKAQARIATVRMKRAVRHELSRLPGFWSGAALGSPRRVKGVDIATFVSGAGVEVKAGWHLPVRLLWPPRMPTQSQPEREPTLEELFTAEPDRLSRLSFDVAGLYFDWSKTHLQRGRFNQFVERVAGAGFDAARDKLFAGGIVNPSEGRPATHIAERGSGAPEDVDLAMARRQRMRALVDAIEGGALGDVTGILHIGIGGSVLGPALIVDALGRGGSKVSVRFLSNIDGAAFDDAVSPLDPATTIVVVASKTFTTLETLSNFEAAREWLRAGGIADPDGRIIAVTARPEAAVDAGIDETRVLQFGDGVGGRYSLWSSVGVTAAIALGWDAFEELLEGAAEMDRHFRFAEPKSNVPLVAAFADRLYVEEFNCQSRAVFAYDERLRLMPSYLQQLEMESNGKSVKADGMTLDLPSAPITWGGTGTDAQHAVFQLLHQGTVTLPVEFIAVRESDDGQEPEHHRLLLLNAFAQGAALMKGQTSEDAQRSYSGNRPSSAILLDRLDPRSLGALIAFYEHRTFANAVLLGINPFDQFGVELGKQIARELAQGADDATLDPSTRALIERAGV
jgi:glucose-6-phosphate isomerase